MSTWQCCKFKVGGNKCSIKNIEIQFCGAIYNNAIQQQKKKLWIGLKWQLWKPFLVESTSESKGKQREMVDKRSDKMQCTCYLPCEMSKALSFPLQAIQVFIKWAHIWYILEISFLHLNPIKIIVKY